MVEIEPIKGVSGEIEIPGDKSITHRAFIFSSIAEGVSFIRNPNRGDDVSRTREIMERVGAEFEDTPFGVKVKGVSLSGIKEPEDVLFAGNSGTTMRLLSGLFSSFEGKLFIITGDEFLRKRPMRRIVEPISLMGGFITGRENGNFPPLVIVGKKLHGIRYRTRKPSAQVKSAIILAAIRADGVSEIFEDVRTRDHTEIMLREFEGRIEVNDGIKVYPTERLSGREIFVPGDFSSASYLIVFSLLSRDSSLVIRNVSLNPTRIHFLNLLIKSGANIKILREEVRNGERFGDIEIKSSEIEGIRVKRDEAPLLIDELPLIGVMGPFLDNGVYVEGAEELRVKESDRIKLLCDNLRNLNVDVLEMEDGFVVKKGRIERGFVRTGKDHRIALSFSILGFLSKDGIVLEEGESISISFPEFFDIVRRIGHG